MRIVSPRRRFVCTSSLPSVTVLWKVYLPVVYGVILGGEERYGGLDENGNFFEMEDPQSALERELQPLREDLALEMPCSAEILDIHGSHIATAEINVVQNHAACVAIRACEGLELNGQVLRQVPISRLVREAARGKIVHLRDGFGVRFVYGLSETEKIDVPTKSRRWMLDEKFLSQVAQVYRTAIASDLPPAVAVQERFGPTTPENARRWIMIARREGFLGKSLGIGKKGEAQEPGNSS